MKATPKKRKKPERDPVAEMRKRARAEGYTPERAMAEMRAFQEIRTKYPGQYALIRERWDGEKLVEPFLLAVDPAEGVVAALFHSIPKGERNGVQVRYVHPAGQAFAYFVGA